MVIYSKVLGFLVKSTLNLGQWTTLSDPGKSIRELFPTVNMEIPILDIKKTPEIYIRPPDDLN